MVAANLRQVGRALAIRALSLRKLGAKLQPGIRFVCYHDVLADEAARLEDQLLWMKKLGTFIDLDRAINLMDAGSTLDHPYFTVTFDDGLETTYREAWPVFRRLGIPLSILLITSAVGQPGYMSWEDVAEMAKSPLVTFGSHTVNHRNLMGLSADDVRMELTQSKATIEARLKKSCVHFCCPWGRPDCDFRTARDPQIATKAGYRSFLTTQRGLTHTSDRLPLVKRDVIHMDSSHSELVHFLF